MTKKAIRKRNISKDCWDMEHSFYRWLKDRLPVYLHDAGKMVDLTYHKFEFEGKSYTQEEMIKMLLSDVIFLDEHNWGEKGFEVAQKRAMKIWELIIPSMWW